MKKLIEISTVLVFLAQLSSASVLTFQPNPADLYDLDHHNFYTWGFNVSIPGNEMITGASLFFDNIENWDNNPNWLYVHLLDNPALGVSQGWDGEGGGDNFIGQGTELFTWTNLPATPQDLTYNFTPSEISALTTYLSNGLVGFGLDPDCHYWNDGVTFTIKTEAVPEPGTILLLGLGVLGLGFLRRKKS